MKILRRKTSSSYNPHNKVRFVNGGAEFFDELVALIRKANRVIHFQTYIFKDDKTGTMIKNELSAAAARGVRVYLLCDGYATSFGKDWIRGFEKTGIAFRYFEPIFSGKKFYFGRRLHHKVVVADERYSLVGGINISDSYHGGPSQPAWLDYAVHTEGQAAATLHAVCEKVWSKTTGPKILPHVEKKVIFSTAENPNPVLVRVRRNDWVRGQIQIVRSYVEMMHRARHDLLIVSSYFLPSRLFRLRMQKAARRGVRVRVVLAGVSDIRISRPAARYLYGWMLQNGIEIYEYNRTVLHAKMATCDGEWMTIGSYNINALSASASIELNIDVRETSFVGPVNRQIDALLKRDCRQITLEDYSLTRNLYNRFSEWGAYVIARILLFLFTYNLKQEKES